MREGDRRLSCPATFPGRFLELRAGGESPGGSGWRSCAAAQQPPELAAAGRWAGKLSSAFLQLAAGGSPLDTPPPRYVRARPRGATARAGTPLAAPLALRPFRPRALQAARCLWALREAPCLFAAGVAPAARTPGLGRAVLVQQCLRSEEPGPVARGAWGAAVLGRVGSARGDALSWGRRLLLHACPRSSSPWFLPTPAGRAGHFHLGA